MQTIAYIANEFPNAVEWYVAAEIREFRERGVQVVPCSATANVSGQAPSEDRDLAYETISLRPLSLHDAFAAAIFGLRNARILRDLFQRIFWQGEEGFWRRARCLAHTLLGAALALRLRPLQVNHIHAHHGYYASWIALVASRLLGVPFSLTLHGSDLLMNGSYLDLKLEQCAFCRTVSEFNRRHILAHFPQVDPSKVAVHRLGVELPASTVVEVQESERRNPLRLLSVGRLHTVKNHEFLLRACYLLRECSVNFDCWIAGDGPERRALEFLRAQLRLENCVHFLGAIPRRDLGRFYDLADLVVLTSHSEGIPLVLMEAMARARVVLAPSITGIPELVVDGKTGFLYPAGDLEAFVWRVDQIGRSLHTLNRVRRAARERIRVCFERQKNLASFVEDFFVRSESSYGGVRREDPVLQ